MKICRNILFLSSVILAAAGIFFALTGVEDRGISYMLAFIILLLCILNIGYYLYFRKRFVRFTDGICRYSENLIHGEPNPNVHNQETLTSKAVMELEKAEDVLRFRIDKSETEKSEIQKIISEITHQLKTPVSNIRMYHEMLTQPDVDREDAKYFTSVVRQQLTKLEFLIESLIKSSRLESEMIKLNPENADLYQTLAMALNSIGPAAEKKNIEISVDCKTGIYIPHDVKWTAEAIENILDNAVKYTPEQGKISIKTVRGEMYAEIMIKDTGTGISPEHFNEIFKRFYREKSAARTEGLGLGLYLSRNIITLQGGYIYVKSKPGKGSTFSIFLPEKK